MLTLDSLPWFVVGANSAVRVPFLYETWGDLRLRILVQCGHPSNTGWKEKKSLEELGVYG